MKRARTASRSGRGWRCPQPPCSSPRTSRYSTSPRSTSARSTSSMNSGLPFAGLEIARETRVLAVARGASLREGTRRPPPHPGGGVRCRRRRDFGPTPRARARGAVGEASSLRMLPTSRRGHIAELRARCGKSSSGSLIRPVQTSDHDHDRSSRARSASKAAKAE